MSTYQEGFFHSFSWCFLNKINRCIRSISFTLFFEKSQLAIFMELFPTLVFLNFWIPSYADQATRVPSTVNFCRVGAFRYLEGIGFVALIQRSHFWLRNIWEDHVFTTFITAVMSGKKHSFYLGQSQTFLFNSADQNEKHLVEDHYRVANQTESDTP